MANKPVFVSAAKFHQLSDSERKNRDFCVHKSAAFEVKEVEGEDRSLDFIISTAAEDRDNDTISVKGWDLRPYKKNPVVLFGHDHGRPPVATASKVGVDGEALVATAKFLDPEMGVHEHVAFSDMLLRMYKARVMRATSVGFRPIEYERRDDEKYGLNFKKQELLEFSLVPVGSNPEALAKAAAERKIDILPLYKWCEMTLDDWEKRKSLLLPRSHIVRLKRASDPKQAVSVVIDVPKPEIKEAPEATPMVLHSKLFGDARGVQIEGNIPRFTKIYADGFELSDMVQQIDDEVTLELDDFILTYKEVGDEYGDIDQDLLRLHQIKFKPPISYMQAHGTEFDKGAVVDEADPWNLDEQLAEVAVSELLQMSAWRAPKPKEQLTAEDFKAIHHYKTGEVSLRGIANAMRSLLSGEIDLPEDELQAVYLHLAEHLERDFKIDAPMFKFVRASVLRMEPDFYQAYMFDEDVCELLYRLTDKDIIPANSLPDDTVIPAPMHVSRIMSASKQEVMVVQSLIFPKEHWSSADECKSWAEQHDFRSDKVDETDTSYRLRQRDPADFQDGSLRTICMMPNDEPASSDKCKVKATVGKEKAAEVDDKITQEELVEMFGETMPLEAVELIYDTAGAITVDELRAKLYELATREDQEVDGPIRRTSYEGTPIDLPDLEPVLADLSNVIEEVKRGRVLSAANEQRIRTAQSMLTECLATLGEIEDTEVEDGKDYALLIEEIRTLVDAMEGLAEVRSEEEHEEEVPSKPTLRLHRIGHETDDDSKEKGKTDLSIEDVVKISSQVAAVAVDKAFVRLTEVMGKTVSAEINKRVGRID